jgi:short-subunit dehydrogenase
VTGASAGVGRATARAFASGGAKVGLIARGRDGLEATRREIEHAGGEALVFSADVACSRMLEAAADTVEAAFGPIDVWVNNAMVSVLGPVDRLTPAEFRRVTEVTYLGTVHGTLAALHRMLPRDRGCIVQVGSALAHRGVPLQAAYAAAKHAVKGFSESLHCELIQRKSRVRIVQVHLPAINTTHFGWVRSRMPSASQPFPPIYQPEQAAAVIVDAAERRPRDAWLGVATRAVAVLACVAPHLLDRYLAWFGCDAQQTSDPMPRGRPDNLWAPVPGDHGTSGPFTETPIASFMRLLPFDGWLRPSEREVAPGVLDVRPAARPSPRPRSPRPRRTPAITKKARAGEWRRANLVRSAALGSGGGGIRTPKAKNRRATKSEEIPVPIEPASDSSPKAPSLKSPEEPSSDPKKAGTVPGRLASPTTPGAESPALALQLVALDCGREDAGILTPTLVPEYAASRR